MLIDLDLQPYAARLKLKQQSGKRWVFDPVRRKWVVLQPEEFVRQLLLLHLLDKMSYPPGFVRVEMGLRVNELDKRCDVLVYDRQTSPWLLVECKAPQVALDQDVFRQIAIYNMPLRVPYLLTTNGRQTYCCRIDIAAGVWKFVDKLPPFPPSRAESR